MPHYRPAPDPGTPLAKYWKHRVSELASVPEPPISRPESERHSMYSLMLMSLLAHYWNGNKDGQDGNYPWRKKQKLPNGIYTGGQYLGHNIAAFAVDGNGEVIDFDFNHNNIFSSSVEHAESRLVRRIFSLTQLNDEWHVRKPGDPPIGVTYSTLLSNVTIYTPLDSCAQRSGIMTLADVNTIVYLQHDPGQFYIGNILRNLTSPGLRAPNPSAGAQFGFEYFHELNRRFKEFAAKVAKTPFYISPAFTDNSPSITSFLCTDVALDIYQRAAAEFKTFKPRYPKYRPLDNGKRNKAVMTNEHVLRHLRQFLSYAIDGGQRGTPH